MADGIDCAYAASRALQWLDNNIDEFIPAKDDKPFDMHQGKHLIELAVMVMCYADLSRDRCSNTITKIIELLRTAQTKRDLNDQLMRFPRMFGLFSDVYGVLRHLGHDDLGQRELLQRVIDTGFPDYIERVPHRLMDIRLSLEWGHFLHSWPTLETMYSSSILSKVPCALYLDEGATYALTHVIIFLYGCGVRNNVSLPRAELEGLFSALVVVACQERHWDLLGELLFCWDCIGLPGTTVYERAWKTFLALQKEQGAFPGPESGVNASRPEDLPDNQRAFFHSHYHTTIVAVMACAVHVNRHRHLQTVTTDCGNHAANIAVRPTRKPSLNPCIAKAQGWLNRLLANVEAVETTPQKALCHILVGSWICNCIGEGMTPAFGEMAARAWKTLLFHEDGSNDVLCETPPTLKLAASAILLSEGLSGTSLQAFLFATRDILNATPATDALTDMSLCEKRVLLHTLGLHDVPKTIASAELMTYARTLPLTASPASVENLLLHINSFTAYGTRNVTLAAADLWIRELLDGLATHFLRQYDLIRACKLLRSMCYLGLGVGKSFDDCIGFLYLHQRPEGAFGFFGPEEAKMKATMPKTFSPELDLYLPVALSCLLTLAESGEQNWRLYRSLPRLLPQSKSTTQPRGKSAFKARSRPGVAFNRCQVKR